MNAHFAVGQLMRSLRYWRHGATIGDVAGGVTIVRSGR